MSENVCFGNSALLQLSKIWQIVTEGDEKVAMFKGIKQQNTGLKPFGVDLMMMDRSVFIINSYALGLALADPYNTVNIQIKCVSKSGSYKTITANLKTSGEVCAWIFLETEPS